MDKDDQHLSCDCEWQSHNSEGVFRQLYADAWSRDHGWGHDVEMACAGDEILRWRVESKRWGIVSFIRSYHHGSRQVYRNLDVPCTIVEILWLA